MLKIFDSYVQLADDDGIEKTYEQAQALDPSRPDIYVRYINQLIDTNAYDDAVEVVTTARENQAARRSTSFMRKFTGSIKRLSSTMIMLIFTARVI